LVTLWSFRSPPVTVVDGMTKRLDTHVAKDFGARLRTLRDAAEISQERLAHDAGLSWSTVSQVERGDRSVRLPTLLRLAAALGVTPGELLDGIRPPT